MCDRCNLSKGTLGHTFWFCPKIVPLCPDVFTWYCKVYDVQTEPDALIALLGCSEASFAPPHSVKQTLMFSMLVAKKIILKEWKTTSASCWSRWVRNWSQGSILRGLAATHIHEKSESTWGPIITH